MAFCAFDVHSWSEKQTVHFSRMDVELLHIRSKFEARYKTKAR